VDCPLPRAVVRVGSCAFFWYSVTFLSFSYVCFWIGFRVQGVSTGTSYSRRDLARQETRSLFLSSPPPWLLSFYKVGVRAFPPYVPRSGPFSPASPPTIRDFFLASRWPRRPPLLCFCSAPPSLCPSSSLSFRLLSLLFTVPRLAARDSRALPACQVLPSVRPIHAPLSPAPCFFAASIVISDPW